MARKLPISLCTFVKDEENTITGLIENVGPIVSELVVVDTGSTDKTVEICKRYTPRVYEVPFTDFGSIRTLTAHLASFPWVLMLDADERILKKDLAKFVDLINQKPGLPQYNLERDEDGNIPIDSWALPRKRWADRFMKVREDEESWPDWQVRLFRNHSDKRIHFRRRVHETVTGAVKTEHSLEGPVIQHLQNVDKGPEKKKGRARLYRELYNKDIADGVEHSESPVVEIDEE